MGNRIVQKSIGSGNWDETELVGFPENGVVFITISVALLKCAPPIVIKNYRRAASFG